MKKGRIWEKMELGEDVGWRKKVDEEVGWRKKVEEEVGWSSASSVSPLPHHCTLCRTRGGVFVQCSDEFHIW